eukprot:gene23701-29947_t
MKLDRDSIEAITSRFNSLTELTLSKINGKAVGARRWDIESGAKADLIEEVQGYDEEEDDEDGEEQNEGNENEGSEAQEDEEEGDEDYLNSEQDLVFRVDWTQIGKNLTTLRIIDCELQYPTLNAICKACTELLILDISGNKIESLDKVTGISEYCTKLEELNADFTVADCYAGYNRFGPPIVCGGEKAIETLKIVVKNDAQWDCDVRSESRMEKKKRRDVRKSSGGCLQEMFSIKSAGLKYTTAKWNPQVEGQLAVGCNNGAVIIFNHVDKTQKAACNHSPSPNGSTQPVVDIQFDHLSVLYMLVAYTYFISLWDIESGTEIHVFDKQSLPITSIAWLDWTAGNFLSTNSRNSSFKIWNASQKAPLEILKISNTTNNTNGTAGSALTSGVAIGYDGTMKIWNIHDLSLVKTLPGNSEASYCVAWSKLNENFICSTSSDQSLIVMHVSVDALYDVNNANVALGSRRKGDTKKDVTPSDIRYRFKHPAPVFGVSWCPSHAPILASCCADGVVRVFNYTLNVQLVAILLGHKSRAFSVAWSPLWTGHLATGSDDCNVIVWEVGGGVNLVKSMTLEIPDYLHAPQLTPKEVLTGHTSNVRALQWSFEHKHLLLSGSWDSSIRLWNTLTATCLMVLSDHIADVYAISCHADRPCVFISSSRDTTIRVWEMEDVFSRLRLNAAFDCSLTRVIDSGVDYETDSVEGGEVPATKTLSEIISVKSALNNTSPTNTVNSAGQSARLTPKLFGAVSSALHQQMVKSAASTISTDKHVLNGIAEAQSTDGYDSKPVTPTNRGRKEEGKEGGQISDSKLASYQRVLPSEPLLMARAYYQMYSFFCGSASGVMD